MRISVTYYFLIEAIYPITDSLLADILYHIKNRYSKEQIDDVIENVQHAIADTERAVQAFVQRLSEQINELHRTNPFSTNQQEIEDLIDKCNICISNPNLQNINVLFSAILHAENSSSYLKPQWQILSNEIWRIESCVELCDIIEGKMRLYKSIVKEEIANTEK